MVVDAVRSVRVHTFRPEINLRKDTANVSHTLSGKSKIMFILKSHQSKRSPIELVSQPYTHVEWDGVSSLRDHRANNLTGVKHDTLTGITVKSVHCSQCECLIMQLYRI